MGRPKDKHYWNQVRKLGDGVLQCNGCGHKFKGGVSRIKAHVDRKQGQGIATCSIANGSVPDNEGVDNNITADSNNPGAVSARNSLEVAGHARVPIDNNIAGSSNLQNRSHPINLFEVAGRAQEMIDNNIISASSNHENVTDPMILFEGARRTHSGMNDNSIHDLSYHQNGTHPMNSFEVVGGIHEMIDINIAGSSYHQNGTHPINLFAGLTPMDTMIGSGNSASKSEISHLKELFRDLTCEEDDIKGHLRWLESQGKKRKREVDNWLTGAKMLKDRTRDMHALVDQSGSTGLWGLQITLQQLTEEVRKHKEQKPLALSNELVGQSFEKNIKKMWELLGNDQIFIIGIHGMGGVGKTSLVTHINNEITRKGTFKHVIWVTVSQNFSIFKLQNDIAERIGIKLEGDNERIRATNLSLALEAREKSVLILDDVWKYIDLQKVGIPVRLNGIKLILTSRLEHVCRQMDCLPNNIIRMELLSDHEAWELFLLKLGYHGTPATLPPKLFEIVFSVAMECHGLPLGINVMARTMKGVNDIHQWRHALKKLQNSAMGEEMGEEVFEVLKLSYDNLIDKNMRNCLLYCALYHKSEIEEFIMKLVDEGLINGLRSLEEIFDEGHAILDKLKGHSLLGNHYFPMQGQVRDMAWHILKLSHKYMVKCNLGLTKIPHMQEWTANLEKVSLMQNKIEEIPVGTSPLCPRLSTLIFSGNLLSRIPECFFIYMNALAVLDLSGNPHLSSLPNSLSNLRSLTSLVLKGCQSLKYVPPLGQLQALSRLDISLTSIHEVPQGLEMLTNLKWLELSKNNNLTLVPGYVLPGLTNMQYLNLQSDTGSTKVKVEDVHGMRMLEYFAGSFYDSMNFNAHVHIQDRGFGPKTYYVHVGDEYVNIVSDYCSKAGDHNESQIISFGDCEELVHLLPRNLAKLYISNNKQWRCLCDALSFNGPSHLRYSNIRVCPKLESLFCHSASCSLCTYLQNLEYLHLNNLESLAVIWKENDGAVTQFLPPGGMFSHLRHIQILECHKMEKLLTLGSLPQVQNLEVIKVKYCNSMKEIFALESPEDNADVPTITLPKLKRLELTYLPQLKIVFQGIMVCGSSQILEIDDCPNLERHPTIEVSSEYSSFDGMTTWCPHTLRGLD